MVSEPLRRLSEFKSCIESARKVIVPTQWEMERIESYISGLLSFAKFKVGDAVKMAETYPVNTKDSWGWMSYRHLLRKGQRAVVKNVDWYDGAFRYEIQFIENTWIDDKDVIRSKERDGGYFTLSQRWLVAVSEEASNEK